MSRFTVINTDTHLVLKQRDIDELLHHIEYILKTDYSVPDKMQHIKGLLLLVASAGRE